jgi:hemerythrin-like domain-containing protein
MGLMDTLKKTMTGDEGNPADADILETLKQDHDDVADMLGRLVASKSAAERKKLLVSITGALVPHLRAEEKVVYETVRGLRGREQHTHAEEGFIEHGLADRMLSQLGRMSSQTSTEFDAGAKVLKELVEHHVEEEEKNIWSDIEDNFSAEDRIAINRKFLAAKARVKVPA